MLKTVFVSADGSRKELNWKAGEKIELVAGKLIVPAGLHQKLPTEGEQGEHRDGEIVLVDDQGNTYTAVVSEGTEVVVASSDVVATDADTAEFAQYTAHPPPPPPPVNTIPVRSAPPPAVEPADTGSPYLVPALLGLAGAGAITAVVLANDDSHHHGSSDDNDNSPVYTGPLSATVKENTTGTVLTASATDADGDTLSYSLSGADAALFQINQSTGAIQFKAAPDFENPLDSGQNNVYDLTVNVSDGEHVTTQAVQVTVTDVLDESSAGNTVVGGNLSGSVKEATPADAGTPTATGQLTADDPDQGAPDNQFVAANGNATYGTFAVTAAGAWTYTLDNANATVDGLADGATLTDSFVVTTADGTKQTITVTINGATDVTGPNTEIGGNITGDVVEATSLNAGTPDATGQLTAADPDLNAPDNTFLAATGAATYGSFEVTAAGLWTYHLDNANTKVDALADGETLTDTFVVKSADGTPETITVTIKGATDPNDGNTVINGDTLGTVKEATADDAGTPTVTGSFTADDPDAGAPDNAFIKITAQNSTYGSYSVTEDGKWTYTLDNANPDVDALNDGETLTDTFKVETVDGTMQAVTITIDGATDPIPDTPNNTKIDGDLTGSVTEGTNGNPGIPTANGVLTADDGDVGQPDNLFIKITGNSTYGSYAVTEDGHWSYLLNNANPTVNALATGDTLTDKFTVTADDGSKQDVTITIKGVTDVPEANNTVITGVDTGSVTEATALNPGSPTALGQFKADDPDPTAPDDTFLQAKGSATYGSYEVTASGLWTYTLDNANPTVDALATGSKLTDTFHVTSADGTTKDVTITINGATDIASGPNTVVGGVTQGTVTEATSQNPGSPTFQGQLTADDPDPSAPDNSFLQIKGASTYGSYEVTANGQWSYTLDNANPTVDALATGSTLKDSFIVTTADGTTKTIDITINGATDSASGPNTVIGGVTSGAVLEATPFNPGTPSFTGQLTAADPDLNEPDNTFLPVSGAATYGSYGVTANGVWTYNLDNTNPTVDALATGATLVDSFTVTSADGTTKVISVTINGATDPVSGNSVITGNDKGTVTESTNDTPGQPVVTGQLSADDPDSGAPDNSFFATSGTTQFGSFDVTADGKWTYTLNDANKTVNALNDGDTLADSFVVKTADGSVKTVNIEIDGATDPIPSTPNNTAISGDLVGSVTEAVEGNPGVPTATGAVLADDADPGQPDNLFIKITGNATYGSYAVTADGHWTYNLNNSNPTVEALSTGQQLLDSFTVTSADGSTKDVTITINGATDNDLAIIGGIKNGSVTESGILADGSPTTGVPSVSGNLTITDSDPGEDQLVLVSQGAGKYGTFSINPTGAWIYTLDNTLPATQALAAGAVVQETFKVQSADGSASTDVVITVNGTNDAPVVNDTQVVVLNEDTSAKFSVVATDVDTATLKYTAPTLSAGGGQVVDNGNGSFTYTPTANFNGADSVVVTVDDGKGGTDTQTVTFKVAAVADAPEITSNGGKGFASIGVVEGSTAVTTVTAIDDGPASELTYSISGGAQGDFFKIDPNTGALTFRAPPDYENGQGQADPLSKVLGLPGNYYEVQVKVTDAEGLSDTQTLGVSVTDSGLLNELLAFAPTIVAPGIGNEANVTVEENTQFVTKVHAIEPILDLTPEDPAYYIAGGADADLFVIDKSTGALQFINAPDFENPLDAGKDNTYEVIVQANDTDGADYQKIYVAVKDNDDLNAVDDKASAKEAGGTDNTNPAPTPVTGNVLTNDFSEDTPNAELLAVKVGAGFGPPNTTVVPSGTSVAGTYGTLTIKPDGTYTYTLDESKAATQALAEGVTKTDVFRYTAADSAASDAQTDNATLTITVTGSNDAPTVDLNGSGPGTGTTATFTEDAAATKILGLALVSDPDSTLQSATIKIAELHEPGDEFLAVTTTKGLTATYNDATGVLTVTGTGTVADYQTVINSLTYQNKSNAPDEVNRTVTVSVNDGALDSNVASVDLTIHALNDAPIAVADKYSLTEDVALKVDAATGLLLNDSDPDLEPFQIVKVNGAEANVGKAVSLTAELDANPGEDPAGKVTVQADGSFVFDPNGNFDYLAAGETATVKFNYTIADGDGATSKASVTLTVEGLNDAPVVDLNGGAAGIDYHGQFTENAGKVAIVDSAALTAIDPDLTDKIESATIKFTGAFDKATDSLDATGAVGGITETWNAATGTLTLTGTASAADYQALLRTLVFDSTSDNPTAVGATRTVEITINDGDVDSKVATSVIDIIPVNDPPVAVTDKYSIDEDTQLKVDGLTGLLKNDTDAENDPLTVGKVNNNAANVGQTIALVADVDPNHAGTEAAGQLTVQADGSFTFDPTGAYDFLAAGDTAVVKFTYAAKDGTDYSNNVNVALTVTGVNDAPVVDLNGALAGTGFTATFTEDGGPVAIVDSGALAVSDIDNGDKIEGAVVKLVGAFDPTADKLDALGAVGGITETWNAATGTLTLTGTATAADYQALLRTVVFDNSSDNPLSPSPTRTVEFTVNDGDVDSKVATATINMVNVNDTPVAVDDAYGTTEDDVLTVDAANGLLKNDTDPDGDALKVTAVNGDTTAVGKTLSFFGVELTVQSDGSFVLDPTGALDLYPAGFVAPAPFTYTVSDAGGLTSTATFTLTVTGVNDAPVVDLNGVQPGIDYTSSFTEGSGPVAIVDSAALTASDVDLGDMIEGATIKFVGSFDKIGDVLDAQGAVGGITESYDASTGTLTLAGTQTAASYEALLRTLVFDNTGENPSGAGATRTVAITINDGDVDSTAATATVNITEINDKPVVDLNGNGAGKDSSATFTEGGGAVSIVGNIGLGSLTVTDVDNTKLQSATITLTNHPDNALELLSVDTTGTSITAAAYDSTTGILFLSGEDTLANYEQVLRTLAYDNASLDPDPTNRIVTVSVFDGTDSSNDRTSTVTVVAVNSDPTFTDLKFDETGFTYKATDVDGDPLTAIPSSVGKGLPPTTVFNDGSTTTQGVATSNNATAQTYQITDGTKTVDVATLYIGKDGVNDTISAASSSLPIAMYGNTGDDTLTGSSGDDFLFGGQGNDKLDGGAGNDYLHGGAGSNTLTGGLGSDTLIGGGDQDLLFGDDTDALLDGGGGIIDGLSLAQAFTAQSDAQIVGVEFVIFGAPGTLDLKNQTEGMTIYQAAAGGAQSIYAGSGDDTIQDLSGVSFADILSGGAGADKIIAGLGNDTLIGDQADTLLDGGMDVDTLQLDASFVNTSDAQIQNIEIVSFAGGTLTLDLQTEAFKINALAASTIVGGGGADTITGSSGNDVLDGGVGADTLNGGDGDDTLIGAQGDALLDGGNNTDTLQLAASFTNASDAQIKNVEIVQFSGAALDLTLQTEGFTVDATTAAAGVAVAMGFGADKITGSAFADSLSGGAGADEFHGGGGDDAIFGETIDTLIDGGAGTKDTLWLITAGGFDDSSDGQIVNTEWVDIALGASGTYNFDQQTEGLNIASAVGNLTIVGGSGNDNFYVGATGSTVTGGGGADQFRLIGNIHIVDFTVGTDVIGFAQGSPINFSVAGSAAGTALVGADYQNRNSINGIQLADSNHVIEIQNAQSNTQIMNNTGGAANAFVLVFDSTSGNAELWYDNDWSDAANRSMVVSFDNLHSAAQVQSFTAASFVEYTP